MGSAIAVRGRKIIRGVTPFGAVGIGLTVALAVFGTARAENECGRPPTGTPITCSPSNYNGSTDGNIVYRITNADGDDFVIRFMDDLSIRYDLDDPQDDRLFFTPAMEIPLYSAVRIETDGDYTGDISFFSVADVTSDGRGISVAHNGSSGALRTEITGGSFLIESEWSRPHAIYSYRGDGHETEQEFSGDNNLLVRNVSIDSRVSTNEDEGWGAGIGGFQGGEGDLNVTVQDSETKVNSRWATGVLAYHNGNGDMDVNVHNVHLDVSGSINWMDGIYSYHGGQGNVEVNVHNTDIKAHEDSESGHSINGIGGYHTGQGNVEVNVRNTDITSRGGTDSNGIAYSYYGEDSAGTLSVDARDVNIQVRGRRFLDGIFGHHDGTGAIDVDVHRADIMVTGADSGGIAFVHDGGGDIAIAARHVDINVHGDRSVGIGGGQRYEGTGDVAINVHDSTVAVTGEQVAGIRSFNFTGEGAIDVEVDGGTITAQGPGSSGILLGLTGRLIGDRTGPIKAPAGVQAPDDGSGSGNPSQTTNRSQNVVVNGRVWGGSVLNPEGAAPVVGSGVRLYGGGRVQIGPRGSVGADSGVAVSAEAEGAELHVAFDGRRPSEAIAGEIRNDDGMTTISVDGVVLHDGTTGATDLKAPNGARDVSIQASETVEGRVFSLTDFVRTYGPRAAVYEALPGFVLRLDQGGRDRWSRLPIPGLPAWVKVSAGQGSYEPDRSHVGGAYDFNRFATEAGVEFALSREQNVTGWASLRHVKGSADVSAPTGGGEIEASGLGGSAGVSWENTAGQYAGISVSLTRYETDLRSDQRGLLKDGAGATVRTLEVETGRRFSLADHLSITPQAWLTRSEISMDNFQDMVGSQVSLREAARSMAGLGVIAETTRSWDDGKRTLDLRGRLGVEWVLGDAETVVEVSGERLGSEADRTRVALGVGAVYHWNRWSLGGEVSASALGSDDNQYAVSLRLGTKF